MPRRGGIAEEHLLVINLSARTLRVDGGCLGCSVDKSGMGQAGGEMTQLGVGLFEARAVFAIGAFKVKLEVNLEGIEIRYLTGEVGCEAAASQVAAEALA